MTSQPPDSREGASSDDAAGFVLQARLQIARRQYQEAIKSCRLGLLRHPTLVDGRLVLAQALMALGRHDEVLAEMRVALETEPDHPEALLLQGEALYLKGDLSQAEEALRRARERNRDQQRITLLLDQIATARRDGLLPDHTCEGSNTREYPAFRDARQTEPPVEADPLAGVVPQTGRPPLEDDYDEPDATVVDEGPPAAMAPPAAVSPAARRPPPPAHPPWPDVQTADELTNPLERLPGRAPGGPAAAAAAAAAAARPSTISGSFDNETGLPLTETGSIELTDFDDDGEPLEPDDDGVEPDETVRRPDPAPARPAPTGFDEEDEPDSTIRRPDPAPARAVAGPVAAPRPAASSPGAPLELLGAGAGEPATTPLGFRGDAARRAAGSCDSTAPETPRAARSRPRALAPGRPLPPAVDEEEEDTTTARPAPGQAAAGSVVSRLTALLGPGSRTRTIRLAIVIGAAVLFLLATSLVIGAVTTRHRVEAQLSVGARQVATGNYPGYQIALRAYEQAVAERPRDARVLGARAATAAAMVVEFGEPAAPARAALAAAQGRAPEEPDVLAAAAALALAQGDLPEAVRRARALTERAPRDPRGPYLEARVRLLEGAYPAAVPLLAESLARDPRHIQSLRVLGAVHAATRRDADARAAWQKALELNAIHVGTLLDRALLSVLRRVDLEDAEQTLTAVVSGKLQAYAARAQIAWADLILGRLYLERGDGSRAAAALARAVAARPERDPIFADELCAAWLRAGQAARAREELPRFDGLSRPSVPLRRAALALLEGNPETALGELARAPAGDPEARLLRGRALLAARRYDDARAELGAALSLAPRLTPARLALARLEVALGRLGAAQAVLTRVTQDEPGNAEVLEALAEVLLARGDREGARARLAQAVERSPGLATARVQLARLLRGEGKWEQARSHLEAALAQRPDLTEARRDLAQVLYELGDGPGARRELDALLARHADPETAVAAARAAALSRDPDEASRYLDRAEQLNAPRAPVLRERGRAALLRHEAPKAVSTLKRAVSLDEGDVAARVLYVEALAEAGDAAQARKELQRAQKRFSRSPELGLAAGRLDLDQAHAGAALGSLGAALAGLRARGAPPRLVAECLTLTGRAHFDQGALPRAAETLAEACATDPRNAAAQYFHGVVLGELDRPAEGVRALERAVAIDPRFAEAWYRLGEARVRSRAAGAAAAYREYLKLAPTGEYAGDAREKLRVIEAGGRN